MANNNSENKLRVVFNVLPVLGAICVLAGVGVAMYRERLDGTSWGLAGAGVLLFLTLFLRAEIANLKYYLHLLLYSAAVMAICVVLYLFANRYTQKIDMTENKLYSLSEASQKYLKGMTNEVTISLMTPSDAPFMNLRRLYDAETDKLKWEYIDPVKEPLRARGLGENVQTGELFISSGENKKRMSLQEIMGTDYENVLTNAIVDVTRKDRPKMYFVEGHGEVPFEPAAQDPRVRGGAVPSVQKLRDLFKQRGVESFALEVAKEGKVPDDASMVIIAGPKSDLFAPEAQAIEAYLDKGGKLLALVDPDLNNADEGLPNLESLLEKYGVTLPPALVLDAMSLEYGGAAENPMVSSFDPAHAITRDLSKRPIVQQIGGSRPVVAHSQGEWQATPLFKSSPGSWSVTVQELLRNRGQLQPPTKDQVAEQVLAVAVSKGTPQALRQMPAPAPEDKGGMRLVVFGSSQFVRDDFLSSSQLGHQLILNTINWLSEREDMIAVPSKQIKGTPLVLEPGRMNVIFVIVAILIPAALFFGGVTYSVTRRRT
jgi:ABC-type uncharacterized transport system involved in gliding motility auxiliary subunit